MKKLKSFLELCNKKKKTTIAITCTLVFLVAMIFLPKISAVFSDNIINTFSMMTGRLDVKVENLKLYENTSDLTNFVVPDASHETGLRIKPGGILRFSFDIKNAGSAGISSDINLNINFGENLNETGTLLIYPATMSDTDIMAELNSNNDTSAIIKLDASDQTSINSSLGIFNGISQKIDTIKLDSALPNGTTGIATVAGETVHHYDYKLVFFTDDERSIDFSNKKLEVKVDASARLHNMTDGSWSDKDNSYYKIRTSYYTDFVKNGLVLLYDGRVNTEDGYSSTASGWEDLIGSNDGTLIGNPVWGNDHLKFDGIDDKVKFRGDIPPKYTIISTFKLDMSHNVDYQRITAEANSEWRGFPSLAIRRLGNGNRVPWLYGHGVDKVFPNQKVINGTVQIAMSFDGNDVQIYMNGVYIDKIASVKDPSSVIDAYLGGRAANDRQLKAEMYNYMIYDRPLTLGEIMENYQVELSKETIPLRTGAQFKKIGSNETIEINGINYHFTPDAQYEVKRNISFDYNGIFTPNLSTIGRITSFEKIATIRNTNDNSLHYNQNGVYVTKDNAIKDGLVLHYDGINNTGSGHSNSSPIWKDLQGSNNATLVGGATWVNNGLSFDGIDASATFAGNITSNYSIVVTIKPTFTGNHPRLFGENPFPSMYLRHTMSYGLSFYGQGKDTHFLPVTVPSLSDKTYVVITYDGVDVILYVNGVRESSMATTTLPVSTAVAYLGARNTPDRYYTGEIHDFMIYNRALTPYEIERSNITNKSKYN
jgi:hypothetical protein